MKHYIYSSGLFIFITFAVSMTGCSTMTTIPPSSKQVAIIKDSIPNNCQWKGKVSYSQEMKTMNADSEAAQYDKLKDQAVQLGANTVLLSPANAVSVEEHHHGKNYHKISQEPSLPQGMGEQKHYHGKNYHKVTGLHHLSGNAYWCPTH